MLCRVVMVRGRQYPVEEMAQALNPGNVDLVRLHCIDDGARRQRKEASLEMELDPETLTGIPWESITTRGFDEQISLRDYDR
jgi:hypothetical protein